MSISLKKVIRGSELTIAAIVCDGECSFEKVVREVGNSNRKALNKIMATLEVAAQHGVCALDKTKFKSLGNGLFEFKERSAGIRAFCFFDEHQKRLIILHKTWIKAGKDKRQSAEIDKARKEMVALKKMGAIPFGKEELEQ